MSTDRSLSAADGRAPGSLTSMDVSLDTLALRSLPVSAPSVPPVVPKLRTGVLGLDARRALGGLLPLLDDPALRDLLVQVDRGEGKLWIDRGEQLVPVPTWRASAEAVHRLAVSLISAGGRHIDELHPCADVHLGSGIRVHAVLAPVAVAGTAISIRLPRPEPPVFADLVRAGLCGAHTAQWLWRAIRDRRNVLITGGTGTGKTTLLAALLDLSAPNERIITIEDVAELRLHHPHRVALEARQANAEGAGEIPLDQLLREALRMRPDRVVLGECRGREVVTLLTALNTGHDGGAGTLHASSITDVPARLEALGTAAGLEPRALASQVVSALHAVVHVERAEHGHRIASIGTFSLSAAGTLAVQAPP